MRNSLYGWHAPFLRALVNLLNILSFSRSNQSQCTYKEQETVIACMCFTYDNLCAGADCHRHTLQYDYKIKFCCNGGKVIDNNAQRKYPNTYPQGFNFFVWENVIAKDQQKAANNICKKIIIACTRNVKKIITEQKEEKRNPTRTKPPPYLAR